jgi:hypothetical protein
VTTQVNTWIVGASAAIAAVILMVTLAVAGQVGELRADPAQSVPAPFHGSVLTGTQAQAADRSAQADLRNSLVVAKVMQIDEGSFDSADASVTGLAAVEPNLCFVGTGTTSAASGAVCESGTGEASVSVFASGESWAAARMSQSGTCFWIADDATGVTYGTGTPCTGTAAAKAAGSSW